MAVPHCLILLSGLAVGMAGAADPTGSGPEPAIAYTDPSLPSHTVYRPRMLNGQYPVVLWGNGSCIDSNFAYREFLAEIASHGFIVLAIGPHRDTPPPRPERPDDPALWPPFETRYSQLWDGLDWLTAEAGRVESALFDHVATGRVAAMGHSCGGLQAIRAAVDPRITTAVVLNSGMLADDDQYMARHEIQRAILNDLHAPIAYFIGGESDIAWANAENDWADLQALTIPAINANMDVGHGATYQMPGGGPFAIGPLAWLSWQLQGDLQARTLFAGEQCGLCNDPKWTLRRHFPD